MEHDEIVLLIFVIVFVGLIFIIGRFWLKYQRTKYDLSKAILKLGENKIDQEIDSMSLRDVVKRANERESSGAKPPSDSSG